MIPFNSASPQAETTASLFILVLAIAAVILILVTVVVLFAALRFRYRPGELREPVQSEGNRPLEILWTLAPLLVLALVSVLMVDAMGRLTPASFAVDEADIVVTGHQWWWRVEYPEAGVITANEIHIPSGRPLTVQLETADVIHSFWIPELGGKSDLIPGRQATTVLEANRPGTYLGACAEYCGTQHAWMRLRVIAHPENEYSAWLASQQAIPAMPTEGDAAVGAQLFQQLTCVNCHAVGGTAPRTQVGPDLTHLGDRDTLGAGVVTNTPENLALWLRDPQALKPGNHMPNLHLTDEQIRLLVAYLETLR